MPDRAHRSVSGTRPALTAASWKIASKVVQGWGAVQVNAASGGVLRYASPLPVTAAFRGWARGGTKGVSQDFNDQRRVEHRTGLRLWYEFCIGRSDIRR